MVAAFSKFYSKIWVGSCLKDTHREKEPSNKTPTLSESMNMNMDVWLVGTSNQLFIRGS